MLSRYITRALPMSVRLMSTIRMTPQVSAFRFAAVPKIAPTTNFIQPIIQPLQPVELEQEIPEEDKTVYVDSVLRKRRLKMKKHKLRKRRKAQRSLKKRLGKI